jgi:carbamoyl-phosphate synthase small subunit
MERTLSQYLQDEGVVAIAGLDTRKLTRVLRDKGAQNGAILAGSDDEAKAIELARSFPGLAGMDLAKVVSTRESFEWTQTEWRLGEGYGTQKAPKYRVVAFDYGVKYNILRMLAERGCHVTVLPAQATAADALALNPDGVFLSNGPGDPEPCDYAIAATREFMRRKTPVFGICLGHQILGLAVGGRTIKMKFGHHGANHPVIDLANGRVMISSQNHGFAVEESSLPANVQVTHRSLFDGSNQGIRVTDAPAFSFQGHPEASPGPHDVAGLFDGFVEMMEARGQRPEARDVA